MIVHVYRNLHKNCWSVRHKGKVIKHLDELILTEASFHVQPAGRAKVLRENRKNVHAYVKGYLDDGLAIRSSRKTPITYNPYKFGYFYNRRTMSKVEKARMVWFDKNGKVQYL